MSGGCDSKVDGAALGVLYAHSGGGERMHARCASAAVNGGARTAVESYHSVERRGEERRREERRVRESGAVCEDENYDGWIRSLETCERSGCSGIMDGCMGVVLDECLDRYIGSIHIFIVLEF